MYRLVQVSLFASSAIAVTLQGQPKMLSVIADKVKPWSGNAGNVPDGKMFMLRKDPSDESAGFIINTTPNNFLTSTSSSINDISTTPYNDPDSATQGIGDAGANFVLKANTIPIPDASVTGMRGNGSMYDAGSWWIFNAFRLSQTSQPDADPNSLIGFEHNEDYFAGSGGGDCTYKSIGIRYSQDLGKSWTRSVPIVTKGKQIESCDEANRFTGTGDFAAMWNPNRKEWVILAQEGPLVMSASSDPLAKPGSWSRIDPVSGQTQPGFIGSTNDEPLAHGDLSSIAGSNPSIIRDEHNQCWHMVYAKWGGGLAYTNTTDLYRWETPAIIWDDPDMTPNTQYPTLVGDEGDTLATDGKATMYFTAANHVEWGRPLWSVDLKFGGATLAANYTAGVVNGTYTNSTGTGATNSDASGTGTSSAPASHSSSPAAADGVTTEQKDSTTSFTDGGDSDDECLMDDGDTSDITTTNRMRRVRRAGA